MDAISVPYTKEALDKAFDDPLFPNGYPRLKPESFEQWRFQWYKSTDDVIDSLDSEGNPTNDDVIAIGQNGESGHTQGLVTLGPTGLWRPNFAIFGDTLSFPVNTRKGDKVYVRVFNAGTVKAATQSMCFTRLYEIPHESSIPVQNLISDYGWGPWKAFRTKKE